MNFTTDIPGYGKWQTLFFYRVLYLQTKPRVDADMYWYMFTYDMYIDYTGIDRDQLINQQPTPMYIILPLNFTVINKFVKEIQERNGSTMLCR